MNDIFENTPCSTSCVLGYGKNCYAYKVGAPRFCELIAEGRPDYRQLVINKTAEIAQNPTLLEKVKNLAKSAVEITQSGFATVSPQEKDRRLSICHVCEWFHHNDGVCGKCGCNMNVKTSFSSMRCPLEPPKWDVVPTG